MILYGVALSKKVIKWIERERERERERDLYQCIYKERIAKDGFLTLIGCSVLF